MLHAAAAVGAQHAGGEVGVEEDHLLPVWAVQATANQRSVRRPADQSQPSVTCPPRPRGSRRPGTRPTARPPSRRGCSARTSPSCRSCPAPGSNRASDPALKVSSIYLIFSLGAVKLSTNDFTRCCNVICGQPLMFILCCTRLNTSLLLKKYLVTIFCFCFLTFSLLTRKLLSLLLSS